MKVHGLIEYLKNVPQNYDVRIDGDSTESSSSIVLNSHYIYFDDFEGQVIIGC